MTESANEFHLLQLSLCVRERVREKKRGGRGETDRQIDRDRESCSHQCSL